MGSSSHARANAVIMGHGGALPLAAAQAVAPTRREGTTTGTMYNNIFARPYATQLPVAARELALVNVTGRPAAWGPGPGPRGRVCRGHKNNSLRNKVPPMGLHCQVRCTMAAADMNMLTNLRAKR